MSPARIVDDKPEDDNREHDEVQPVHGVMLDNAAQSVPCSRHQANRGQMMMHEGEQPEQQSIEARREQAEAVVR